jgi:hypothetical protein
MAPNERMAVKNELGRLWKEAVKLSRYTPWWHMGGEEVLLLLILNLGARWR